MKGKFVWVQSSAWHPVHQYTQQGFLAGCEELGLDCELATTDENTLEALVALADQVVSRPDAKGVAMWFGGLPVAKPIIEKAKENGIVVALPHFPVDEGFYADNAVQIAATPPSIPTLLPRRCARSSRVRVSPGLHSDHGEQPQRHGGHGGPGVRRGYRQVLS